MDMKEYLICELTWLVDLRGLHSAPCGSRLWASGGNDKMSTSLMFPTPLIIMDGLSPFGCEEVGKEPHTCTPLH